MRHPLVVIVLLSLLLGTSCRLKVSFFVANLSSRTIHVEYAVPCQPDCPSPTLIAVRTLRHDGTNVHGDRPAPAPVQGRVDSLVSYALDLPPDSAVRIFDGGTDFSGTVRDFQDQFPRVRITVDTGQAARSYQGLALGEAFHKWHKLVHVLEVR
jgi:hypothetical protein